MLYSTKQKSLYGKNVSFIKGHEQAQCCIITTPHGSQLKSYESIVAEVYDGYVVCYNKCSMTTIKHLGLYARTLGITYQDLKKAYEEHKAYKLNTGFFYGALYDGDDIYDTIKQGKKLVTLASRFDDVDLFDED